MNDLGLTHLESLDSETIDIPGLDIDDALTRTVARGRAKLRRRRIGQITSAVALVAILGISLVALTSNDTTSTASKKVTTVARVKTTTPARALDPHSTSTTGIFHPTQVSPNAATKVIGTPIQETIRDYGDASLCTPPVVDLSNTAGISVGSSTSVDSWNPGDNETKNVPLAYGDSSSLNIVNHWKSSASNGQYADLAPGFDAAHSYAHITTSSFRYCQSGFKLDINSLDNGAGYALSFEYW